MTESVCKTRSRIQAVKHWLNRADEHFDGNASVRGEMDLLLAEAELRSTREKLQSGAGKMRTNWFRQGIAFAIAAVMVATGMGGAWWWWQDIRTESVPPVVAASPVLPVQPIMAPAHTISAAPIEQPVPRPVAAVDSMSPGQEVKSATRPPNREQSVSQDEMKRLIQTAGHSLRGVTKP